MEKFEIETSDVFYNVHMEQMKDKNVVDRFKSLISTEYFGVPKDYFKGKTVLDIGCGCHATASYMFLELGAKNVISADLGTKWMNQAKQRLSKFTEKSILKSENVLNLTFEDNTFDFVHCAGVLHHTTDPKKGFQELTRVTKSGGMTFVSIMANEKGIIYQCINYLRTRYNTDAEFKELVDNLDIHQIDNSIDCLLEEKEKFEGCTEEEKKFIKSLFNSDLLCTFKDRIQAPTYSNFDFSNEQIKTWFVEQGYTNIVRLTRYVKGFENVRKYLSPLYYHYDNPLSKLFFGEGYIQMIGVKK